MIDWERIAELLTEKWYADGRLPVYQDHGLEYNYILATNFTGFPGDVLRYARTEFWSEHVKPSFSDKVFHSIKVHGQIDKAEAIREVWPLLTETEKTAIMADTLGANVHD